MGNIHTVSVIRGDGIGSEVVGAAIDVINATGVPIVFEYVEAGEKANEIYGTPLPEGTLESIRRNRVALKGPLGTPFGTGYKSLNMTLRSHFQLYLNLRPVEQIPGIQTRYVEDNVNLIMCRMGIEDIYDGKDEGNDEEGLIDGVITRPNCEKFFRRVFVVATVRRRNRVTIVHKANISKRGYGLFLKVGEEISREFPQIKTNSLVVDDAISKLIQDPMKHFDVIAAPNMFGDILSEACAALIGGMGVAPGVNLGDDGMAIFEAAHGTAPDIIGKGIANPTAVVLSAAMMLEYIGRYEAAVKIKKAVSEVISKGIYVTPDLKSGSIMKTQDMTKAIIEKIKRV